LGKTPVDAPRLELNGRESFREWLPLRDLIKGLQVEIIKAETFPSTPSREGRGGGIDPISTRDFSNEQEARHFF